MILGNIIYCGYDKCSGRKIYSRIVRNEDGKIVEIVFSVSSKQKYIVERIIPANDAILPRPMTDDERKLAIARRGRGIGIEPSTVVVSLANNPYFFAPLSTDVDGGLGTVERYELLGHPHP